MKLFTAAIPVQRGYLHTWVTECGTCRRLVTFDAFLGRGPCSTCGQWVTTLDLHVLAEARREDAARQLAMNQWMTPRIVRMVGCVAVVVVTVLSLAIAASLFPDVWLLAVAHRHIQLLGLAMLLPVGALVHKDYQDAQRVFERVCATPQQGGAPCRRCAQPLVLRAHGSFRRFNQNPSAVPPAVPWCRGCMGTS